MWLGRIGQGKEWRGIMPSALKFTIVENAGRGVAEGKERMFGTPVRGNSRESDPGLAVQGPWRLTEVINLH